MRQEDVLKVLGSVGAVIADSHIVYTSGKHGTAYVNKDAVYPYPEKISALCEVLAAEFSRDEEVDVVVAPALGGIVLTQWVAYHLTRFTCRDVLAVYAEKNAVGNFAFTRGYDQLVVGKRVLVVEDVLNTGGSAGKVVDLVRATGGKVIGIGALCNRGGVTAEKLGVPRLVSLVNISLDAWDEDECLLCAKNIPINVEVGKGKDFLARRHNGG